MKLSLDKSKVSFSLPEVPVFPGYSFYEYYWDGPKRVYVPVWQPRQTTLHVVLDGESRHLFSAARILLYYSTGSPKDARSGNVWVRPALTSKISHIHDRCAQDIQQLGPMLHSFRGQVRNPQPNASTLPKLIVAFEVAVGQASSKSPFGTLVLRSPASVQELRRSSITVLLDRELSLTSDTLSLSLSFTHSIMLCTPIMSSEYLERYFGSTHPASWIELITTRIVRVLPPVSTRPRRIANGCLPTELLLKTFKDTEFRHTWHDDLLSFAQVCRAWTCAMDILHARLTFSDNDRWSHSRPLLDVCALAKALREKPLLGRGFRHFTTDNLCRSEDRQEEDDVDSIHLPPLRKKKRQNPTRFTTALITILGTTKNLQYLHLGQLDPSQSDSLFNVLYDLCDLQTLSIGPAEDPRPPLGGLIQPHRAGDAQPRILTVAQLARCMARWPALTSLKIHHLHPGLLNLWRLTLPLRPPTCALTQLLLSRSHVSDRDLAHLFASSGRTLERVVLDRIVGVTNAGLVAFLLGITQSVVYLTVQDVALPPFRQWGHLVIGRTERALDVVVDKMPRLRELRIGGDVASEFMLDRRSKMFVAQNGCGLKGRRVPVVRLWLEDVPRLCGFAADGKWPGWCTPGRAPWHR